MKMSSEASLIIRTGHAPVKAKQYIWYNESSMVNLQEKAVVIPRQIIKPVSFQHIKNTQKLNPKSMKLKHY